MSQIHLRLPDNLREMAEKHVKERGYRNLQELAMEALREKVQPEYDTSFTKKEIRLIEQLFELSVAKNQLVDADTVFKNARSRRKTIEAKNN